MALSTNLISQFVKATNDKTKTKSDKIVYGTIVEYDNSKYVKIDGSDLLTPVSTTARVEDGDRVVVTIKNHTAMVSGNKTNLPASTKDVTDVNEKVEGQITRLDDVIANSITTEYLTSTFATIESLQANYITADIIDAKYVSIIDLEANYATIENLDVLNGYIEELQADNVIIDGKLVSAEANIANLQADYAVVNGKLVANEAAIGELAARDVEISNQLTANKAEIDELEANKLSTTDADVKYANIDFTNIGQAAMEYFYAQSGLIDNVHVGDATITGKLVGVTISGDLIEGNTIKAEKLVVRGEDGLYYKLNVNADGTVPEGVTEDELQNGLHGSHIIAQSITATQISVEDLVAFDATIGGFVISESSLYSGVKSSVDNTTQGIYLDNDGQAAFGDTFNYVKFYVDSDGEYKLDISAKSIILGSTSTNLEDAITNTEEKIGNAEAAIETINGVISTLVVDENGESLMEQNGDGWSFNMSSFSDDINQSISDLQEDNANQKAAQDELGNQVSKLGEYTEYIRFGDTEDGQPYIELGENDSEFKVLITNTEIQFQQGSEVPARINNQTLNIGKAVIETELKQGGFVWMARENGNYGLLWKG